MKYWLMVVFAFAIMGCEFLGAQTTVGTKEKLHEEHFQTNRQLQSDIDIKEKYSLVYGSLKDIYKDYTADVMKTVAFLLICIGWLITSDKSRAFVKKNRVTRISSIIVIAVISIINIYTSIKTYTFSQDKISELSILNYLDPEYYVNYEITIELLVVYLIQNTALFALLITILCSLKEVTYKS